MINASISGDTTARKEESPLEGWACVALAAVVFVLGASATAAWRAVEAVALAESGFGEGLSDFGGEITGEDTIIVVFVELLIAALVEV